VDLQDAVGLEPATQMSGQRNADSVELSNNLRKRLITAGLKEIRDYPVFGVGAGAFRDYVDAYEPIAKGTVVDARPRLPAHNVFLEVWADSGTPAFVLYVTFLGAVLLALERRRRRSDGVDQTIAVALSAALIGLNVTSAFHNYQTENLLWALLGLAVSLELWPGTSPSRHESLAVGSAPPQAIARVAS
jgi:O-antigen ligase